MSFFQGGFKRLKPKVDQFCGHASFAVMLLLHRLERMATILRWMGESCTNLMPTNSISNHKTPARPV